MLVDFGTVDAATVRDSGEKPEEKGSVKECHKF